MAPDPTRTNIIDVTSENTQEQDPAVLESGNNANGTESDVASVERIYRYPPLPSHHTASKIATSITNQTNKYKRKLDYRIIPPFWVLYFLCSAIRSNVGLAQTMNESQGHDLGSVLHASPHQISTGLALFYVCYVVFDLPSNLVMTRLRPHVWMSRIVASVGVIGACMAAMEDAWSL